MRVLSVLRAVRRYRWLSGSSSCSAEASGRTPSRRASTPQPCTQRMDEYSLCSTRLLPAACCMQSLQYLVPIVPTGPRGYGPVGGHGLGFGLIRSEAQSCIQCTGTEPRHATYSTRRAACTCCAQWKACAARVSHSCAQHGAEYHTDKAMDHETSRLCSAWCARVVYTAAC